MTNISTQINIDPAAEVDHHADRSVTQRSVELTALKPDWRRVFSLSEMGVYYALLFIFVILSIITSYLGSLNYLSMMNITNVLYQSSLVGIMGVAMTVLLISGNFDLSVASVAALSAVIFIGLADKIGFWPAAAIGLLIGICCGLLNGAITQFIGINAFIVTLGTMTALRGVILIYTGGHSLAATKLEVIMEMKAIETGRIDVGFFVLALGAILLCCGIFQSVRARKAAKQISLAPVGMGIAGLCLLTLTWATNGRITLSKPVIYMLAFTLIVWFILTFTVVGRRLYAVGGNAEAARLSGINVLRYKLMAFVLCSGTAGFAGILFACRLRSINPAALTGAELTVLAAAILGGASLFGGAGSVIKTLAGALVLYSLSNGFNMINLSANFQGLIEGIVIIVAASIYTVGSKRVKSKTGG